MMSATKVFQKSKHTNNLLKWISDQFGSPTDARQVRITFDPFENSRIKLQIKLPPGSQGQAIASRINPFPGLIQGKTYGKTDFTPEEVRVILKETLMSTWMSTSTTATVTDVDLNSMSQLINKSGFIRPASQLDSEKVIVEYGSPNIAKPLHMGHLRSLVTGHFIARICKAAGHDVTTICFLGDWGTQFGILQAGLAKYLPESKEKDKDKAKSILKSVDSLTLDELLRHYVQAVQEKESNQVFFKEALRCSAALEQGDPVALQVWKSIREKTLTHLKTFWGLFHIKYDVIQGESEFTVQNSFTENALKELGALGVIQVGEDKCVYAVLQPDQKFSSVMKIPLVKKDGTSLYLLRDVACAMARQERFPYDKMIYVVDKAQAHHFIALFRLLELLKIQNNQYNLDEWLRRLRHVMFGKVEGMSTRSGNFVLLSEVISTGSSLMQENRSKSPNVRNVDDEEISTQLAISALIVNSLKIRRNKDVRFDWAEALKPNGETGVNLQYTHARLCSLERNAREKVKEGGINEINLEKLDLESIHLELSLDYLINDPIALNLAVHLVNFEDAFWASYGELEPCILLSYLFRLSDKVSKALKALKVVSEPDSQIATTRLILFVLSRRVLAIGLNVLGIKPLDEI